MFNDLANLLSFFIRFFIFGGAVIAALVWLIIKMGDMGFFPVLIGALPAILVLWAFSKRAS